VDTASCSAQRMEEIIVDVNDIFTRQEKELFTTNSDDSDEEEDDEEEDYDEDSGSDDDNLSTIQLNKTNDCTSEASCSKFSVTRVQE